MRIVLSGYYGFGNTGDEAILSATVRELRSRLPGAEVMVLSADPQRTAREYGVRAIPRAHPMSLLKALARCTLFLSGGGTLLQDATSWWSPLYYLGVLAGGLALAERTAIYAQGFGPLRTRAIRVLARWLLDRVDLITLRDEDSRVAIQELGVRRPGIYVGADPAFLLDPVHPGRVEEILASEAIDPIRPRIMVAARPWGGDFLPGFLEGLREASNRLDALVVFLPMHRAYDLSLAEELAAAIGPRARVIRGIYRPEEVMGLVGAMDVLVGLRLHGLIFAVATGVVPIGLSYDPKVVSLLREVGEGYSLSLARLTPQGLSQSIEQAWANREGSRERLREAALQLRERARKAIELTVNLVHP
ncbi:MAG: polysaccharide pyruvyl transferase CsaB [Armatimonadota bacterium]|nr:polysaccharide pyruvyl transferase CsaB [Armatimonadota bacterium]